MRPCAGVLISNTVCFFVLQGILHYSNVLLIREKTTQYTETNTGRIAKKKLFCKWLCLVRYTITDMVIRADCHLAAYVFSHDGFLSFIIYRLHCYTHETLRKYIIITQTANESRESVGCLCGFQL